MRRRSSTTTILELSLSRDEAMNEVVRLRNLLESERSMYKAKLDAANHRCAKKLHVRSDVSFSGGHIDRGFDRVDHLTNNRSSSTPKVNQLQNTHQNTQLNDKETKKEFVIDNVISALNGKTAQNHHHKLVKEGKKLFKYPEESQEMVEVRNQLSWMRSQCVDFQEEVSMKTLQLDVLKMKLNQLIQDKDVYAVDSGEYGILNTLQGILHTKKDNHEVTDKIQKENVKKEEVIDVSNENKPSELNKTESDSVSILRKTVTSARDNPPPIPLTLQVTQETSSTNDRAAYTDIITDTVVTDIDNVTDVITDTVKDKDTVTDTDTVVTGNSQLPMLSVRVIGALDSFGTPQSLVSMETPNKVIYAADLKGGQSDDSDTNSIDISSEPHKSASHESGEEAENRSSETHSVQGEIEAVEQTIEQQSPDQAVPEPVAIGNASQPIEQQSPDQAVPEPVAVEDASQDNFMIGSMNPQYEANSHFKDKVLARRESEATMFSDAYFTKDDFFDESDPARSQRSSITENMGIIEDYHDDASHVDLNNETQDTRDDNDDDDESERDDVI